MSDVRKLAQAQRAGVAALAEFNVTPRQARMAATLLAVNGLANALAHIQCVFLFVRNVTAPRDMCAVCVADNGLLVQDGYGRHRRGRECWACGCP